MVRRIQIPALPFTSCRALGQASSFLFSHLKTGDHNPRLPGEHRVFTLSVPSWWWITGWKGHSQSARDRPLDSKCWIRWLRSLLLPGLCVCMRERERACESALRLIYLITGQLSKMKEQEIKCVSTKREVYFVHKFPSIIFRSGIS